MVTSPCPLLPLGYTKHGRSRSMPHAISRVPELFTTSIPYLPIQCRVVQGLGAMSQPYFQAAPEQLTYRKRYPGLSVAPPCGGAWGYLRTPSLL